MGCIALLALYGLTIAIALRIASISHSHFGRLSAAGVTATFALYVVINAAMVVGMAPVVGVPMPLMSYGGTGMVTVMIGFGLVEAVRVHQDVNTDVARTQAIEMLERVGIPNPDRRVDDYPHQLSGGMRQRVMIAMALLNDPSLLIADEPTTALDVTVQAQILELLKDLQRDFNTAIIIITHDLGVVADVADEVVVMYGGRVVEPGTVDDIYHRPEMPYTLGLLASMPRLDASRAARLDPIPGLPPSLIRLPQGCVFRPRCTYSDNVPGHLCDTDRPDLLSTAPGHEVRCHMSPEQRREIAITRLGRKTEEHA